MESSVIRYRKKPRLGLSRLRLGQLQHTFLGEHPLDMPLDGIPDRKLSIFTVIPPDKSENFWFHIQAVKMRKEILTDLSVQVSFTMVGMGI